MKNKPGFKIFIYLLISPIFVLCQTDIAKCKIATVARYTSAGTELRWIPDNKTILQLGFDNSFTIIRSDSGTNKFQIITTVKPFSRAKWDSLISIENKTETKANLELAADFLFADKKARDKGLNLEEGIAELNERKGKEDMIYAVFVLTAIKDAKVAEALGLGFIDRTVKAGETYTYKIKINAKSSVYQIEDGEVTLKAILNTGKYKNEVFVYPGDKKLSFVWSSKPELAGYLVERAAEGESEFKPLNITPIYSSASAEFEGPGNGSYLDDSLTNYKWYRYRFYGYTSFGDKVLFAEAKGMPRDLTPPNNPIIRQPKHIKANEVLVEWDIFGDLSDLKGFIIARSDKDTGNFTILPKTLLSNKARNYIDTSFNSVGLNYYIVYALDTAGNISSSYPAYVALIDSTPPSKPLIESAIIDSLGIVTVTVTLGKEKDLMGYRLFKSNSAEHEFSVIEESFKKDKGDTLTNKLVFSDTVTLQTLTPKIYYRIKALDFNYNQSVFSDIVAVKRPDTIPPVTPVFNDVIVGENKIELHFVPSGSIDVKEQHIYRKTALTDDWKRILTLSPSQTQAIDTNVHTGITYYYSIRAMDESKLFSQYAQMVYGKPFDSGVRLPVTNLTANLQNKNVVLNWDYPLLTKEVFFVVYKKNVKGELQQYARITEKTFTDTKTGKVNTYAIKVLTADGGQSPLSPLVIQKTE